MTAFMCEECARKIEKLYSVIEIPNSRLKKRCPLCFKAGEGQVYDLEKIRRYYPAGTGGGERARAGRVDTRDLDELYGGVM